MRKIIIIQFLCALSLFAQNSIDVTFRYYPTSASVTRAFVPGTFNNWGPNSSGVIAVNSPSQMTYIDSLGCYVKTVTLTTGQTYYYKFHEHYDATGSQWAWFTDPLNSKFNSSDNNNSILECNKAIVFQMAPKSGSIVSQSDPLLTAGVFVAGDDSIRLDQSTLWLDGTLIANLQESVVSELSLLRYRLPALKNGSHTVTVRLVSEKGESAADSTQFNVVAGDIAFMTPSCDSIWAAEKTIRWLIDRPTRAIKLVTLNQAGKQPVLMPPTSGSEYSRTIALARGDNAFTVSFLDSSGQTFVSDTLRLRYPAPQKPNPQITLGRSGDKISISGSAIDPQRKNMTFLWSIQITSPEILTEVDGRTDRTFEIMPPARPGDYSIKLTVTDADGFSNSVVNFFSILPDGSVRIPGRETAPQWVHQGRIYCLFFKAFTPQGTIAAALPKLPYIADLGFNVIWVVPIMDVEGQIDQGANIGYNIIDFYHVDPVYGTDADFKTFVTRAHELGLRVILDVTPNHSSRSHPFALDARANKKYSRYYDFYQHEIITHDTNGLGQSISNDGIVYYSGFSDALLNWNWGDAEAQQYMIEVYRYWLREYDIDGFRFDVYWGPHRRYGVAQFDQPLRLALRATKADILLLAETAGTGAGAEDNYAQKNGGADMAYDWLLKDTIQNFPSVLEIDQRLYNSGYRPGDQSFYMRFLENQDEDRIAYRYNSIERTIPISTAIFLATGIPELYQGQEVGMGFAISGSKETRNRSTVNWGYAAGALLMPHYQKLAQIRAQFPAFQTQMQDGNGDGQIDNRDPSMQPRLPASSIYIYAYGRPYQDQNGLVVMNFSSAPISFTLPLNLSQWAFFTIGLQPDSIYYLNNLYNGTSEAIRGSELDTLKATLAGYAVAVYSISSRPQSVTLPPLPLSIASTSTAVVPAQLKLHPCYPNPFNAETRITFALQQTAQVDLSVYNVSGQKVRTLIAASRPAGEQSVNWDGRGETGAVLATGLYFLRLSVGDQQTVEKMMLVR